MMRNASLLPISRVVLMSFEQIENFITAKQKLKIVITANHFRLAAVDDPWWF